MAKKPQNPAEIAQVASKLGELKVRLLFLVGALIVFRIGTYIPVPGVDPVALADFFEQQAGGLLGMSRVREEVFPEFSLDAVQVSVAYPGASLVEAELETGRTHQIRVHAAYAGHPLAGDQKYGDPAFNQRMRELGLKRLFLHAARLSWSVAPRRSFTVEAPLPEELQSFLTRLGENEA